LQISELEQGAVLSLFQEGEIVLKTCGALLVAGEVVAVADGAVYEVVDCSFPSCWWKKVKLSLQLATLP
jgi:hypothetical protein